MDYPRRPLWSYSYTAAPWIDHVPRALQQEPVSHNPESSTTMAGSDTLDSEENAGWNSPSGYPVPPHFPCNYAPPAVLDNGEYRTSYDFAYAGTTIHNEPVRFPSASMFPPPTYPQSSVGAASEQQAGWTSAPTSHDNCLSLNALQVHQLVGPTGDAGFGYDRASSLYVQGLCDVPSEDPAPPHLGISNGIPKASFVGSPGVVYGAVDVTFVLVSPLATAPVGPPVADTFTSLAPRFEGAWEVTPGRPGGTPPSTASAVPRSFLIPMTSMERNTVPYGHRTVQVRSLILHSGERVIDAITYTGNHRTGLRAKAWATKDQL